MALFPYYTDDKITESHDITGSKSIFHITNGDSSSLWEPFKVSTLSPYKITRNLYKNLRGTKILFEEINHDLGLEYSYQWNISDKFGFVRKSLLKNNNSSILDIRIFRWHPKSSSLGGRVLYSKFHKQSCGCL